MVTRACIPVVMRSLLLCLQLARCVHHPVPAVRLLCMASGHIMQSGQTAASFMWRHAAQEADRRENCAHCWVGLCRANAVHTMRY
jgi:isoaspartyl peptidase/L-asparaginase-like protein (Ntn-hydrolase superfamily)